jgi:hypothetical protein
VPERLCEQLHVSSLHLALGFPQAAVAGTLTEPHVAPLAGLGVGCGLGVADGEGVAAGVGAGVGVGVGWGAGASVVVVVGDGTCATVGACTVVGDPPPPHARMGNTRTNARSFRRTDLQKTTPAPR